MQVSKGHFDFKLFSKHLLSYFVDCFTADYSQGSCVPMASCRRIEWLIQNWAPPYPDHITRYIRQSHCGTRGNVVCLINEQWPMESLVTITFALYFIALCLLCILRYQRSRSFPTSSALG